MTKISGSVRQFLFEFKVVELICGNFFSHPYGVVGRTFETLKMSLDFWEIDL